MLILIMHFIGRCLFLWWIIQHVDEKEVKIKGVELKAKYGEYNFKREATKKTDTLKKSRGSRNFTAVRKTGKASNKEGRKKTKNSKK